MIKAINLNTDFLIEKYYNSKDYRLYFVEEGDNFYSCCDGNTLKDIIDASCHGFHFIAINKNINILENETGNIPFINISDIEEDVNEMELEI